MFSRKWCSPALLKIRALFKTRTSLEPTRPDARPPLLDSLVNAAPCALVPEHLFKIRSPDLPFLLYFYPRHERVYKVSSITYRFAYLYECKCTMCIYIYIIVEKVETVVQTEYSVLIIFSFDLDADNAIAR